MQVEPYLFYDGTCADAMSWYHTLLGGELQLMRYSQAPPEARCDMPGTDAQRVMHALLRFPGGAFMASDTPGAEPCGPIANAAVCLTFDTLAHAERIFAAFAQDGTVQVDFGPTFWAQGFGMVRDRFGTPWMINGPITAND